VLVDLVVEQVMEEHLQYLEIPLLVVAVVQEILMAAMLVEMVDLVVEEHIHILMEDLEIPHLQVHLKEILVVMVDKALVAVAAVLVVEVVQVNLHPIIDLVVVMVEVEHQIQSLVLV
jgi:hypothetical protein|tara:strand:+ start:103 stop:453 length:351 start_codon:yes stop_codon:yes gene_type:complete